MKKYNVFEKHIYLTNLIIIFENLDFRMVFFDMVYQSFRTWIFFFAFGTGTLQTVNCGGRCIFIDEYSPAKFNSSSKGCGKFWTIARISADGRVPCAIVCVIERRTNFELVMNVPFMAESTISPLSVSRSFSSRLNTGQTDKSKYWWQSEKWSAFSSVHFWPAIRAIQFADSNRWMIIFQYCQTLNVHSHFRAAEAQM